MSPALQHSGAFLVGLVLLIVGGKLLVSAAVDTARRLNVPSLLVGLTLVAWGTSAPELALNLAAALNGHAELALGNVVGANICNMGLVLGVCALMKPLKVQDRVVRVETWLNAAMLALLALTGLIDSTYTRWEASALLAAFAIYSTITIVAGLRESRVKSGAALVPTHEPEGYPLPPMSWWRIGLFFVAGLALLTVGGNFASGAAVGIAAALGVPESVVAVTIVSIGTTLPEMVTGVLAVKRGQVDLAMGNAIGSCIFNAGAIFGIAGLIDPPAVPQRAALSLGTMLLLAVMLVPIARTFERVVARIEGLLLLCVYAAFLAAQAIMARG